MVSLTYVQTHQVLDIKYMQIFVYQFYLNNTIMKFNKVKGQIPIMDDLKTEV